MPAIPVNTPSAVNLHTTLSTATLNGTTDTFTYVKGMNYQLTLYNPTGSTISSVTLVGSSAPTSFADDGQDFRDLSGGYSMGNIAAGARRWIPLDRAWAYLQGSCSVSNGNGLVAYITADG